MQYRRRHSVEHAAPAVTTLTQHGPSAVGPLDLATNTKFLTTSLLTFVTSSAVPTVISGKSTIIEVTSTGTTATLVPTQTVPITGSFSQSSYVARVINETPRY
ncbi:hypothetical protein DFH07DRAFT_969622 [Mycena maculata]|uniref:Uncharacterized protein n=1 Tax=Mycena maculata TaxID=230809 RepID=A0AAD7MST5_9AGAR|nr:hypothetical protein DFH07DRAFT_969622 [Mycena maculata]